MSERSREMLNSMDVPRFIPYRDKVTGEVVFEPTPHEAESVYSESVIEQNLNEMFANILDPRNESHIDTLLEMCGHAAGSHIARLLEVSKGKDEIYGLALFQGLLEKILLKHGMRIKNHFRNPAFIRGVKNGSPSLLQPQSPDLDIDSHILRPERISEKLTGAVSVVEYIHQLEASQDPRLVFIGSDVFLDTKYAIDLILGFSNDPGARPVVIDEVKIVQVKTKRSDKETIDSIRSRHEAYLGAVKGIEADMLVAELEESRIEPRDLNVGTVMELTKFYTRLGDPEERKHIAQPITWQSIVDASSYFGFEKPAAFYARLLTINDDRIGHLLAFKQNKLRELQQQVANISVPQHILSEYARMTLDISIPSLMQAPVIESVVVAEGRATTLFSV